MIVALASSEVDSCCHVQATMVPSCMRAADQLLFGVACAAVDVTVAQPGYDVNWQDDITNMESQVTTDGNGTLSDPSNYPPACPIGTYYEGGVINSGTTSTCKPCPLGTTTQSTGSTSADECSE